MFWNCNVLRDARLSYGDYIEQLTCLLFLKMADERKQLHPQRAPHFPKGYQWSALLGLEGDALEVHYRKPWKPCAAARFAHPRCARCGTATPGCARYSPLPARPAAAARELAEIIPFEFQFPPVRHPDLALVLLSSRQSAFRRDVRGRLTSSFG